MSTVLAIDPGNTESGWTLIDATTCKPLRFGKTPNVELRRMLLDGMADDYLTADHIVIEMIASYGMSVGADVFETCVWIGRFVESARHFDGSGRVFPQLIKRHPVKMHHCHSARAKDSNITQALVDRFAPDATNHGKGTKAQPGWFYGFAKDVWQAYALAVYAADTRALAESGAPF
ncbi:hypothetical protein [Aeromicrobium sp. 9AM]|uniref:hypothetical protein n=1 Tax=Aeromicrobium sp. 9AM TaxID=2653126 RepID=UPI0012EF2EC0|nr:hypothetical protein [Aeromicrobium sp. 9AM]VXB82850.1 conserved hypothetical protein [Aeromicrobium sp. 9AM]